MGTCTNFTAPVNVALPTPQLMMTTKKEKMVMMMQLNRPAGPQSSPSEPLVSPGGASLLPPGRAARNIGSTILCGRETMVLARLAHVGPTSAQSSRRHQSLAEQSFLGSLHIDQLAAYYNGGVRNRRGG